MEATLKLHITGIKPMLQHNGRLANPIDPYTRAIRQVSKKRNKTDADHAELARIEARAAMYEADDGVTLGFPAGNVWKALHEAAKAFKLGRDIERALIADTAVPSLLVDGNPVKCDTYLDEGDDRMLYVPVKIGTSKTMRARPLIHNWAIDVEFPLLTDVIQPENLRPVIERAGRLVGLGDWRPKYGRFEAEWTVE